MNETFYLASSQELVDRIQGMYLKAMSEKPELYASPDVDDGSANPVGYQVIPNTAIGVISTSGDTVSQTRRWTRWYGIPSYEDIRARFAEAADDQNVKVILHVVDTLGGSAKGVKSTADYISLINTTVKPVITYTEGDLLSAGLWYGTAGLQVFAGEEARIGSLGVIAAFTDATKAYEMEGLTNHVLRTAPLKALGNPREPMTPEIKAYLLSQLQEIHVRFVEGIAKNRALPAAQVQEKVATGRAFPASEALALKLIDGVVTLEQLVARIQRSLDTVPSKKPVNLS